MLYPVVSIGHLGGNGEPVISRKLTLSFEFGGKLVPKSTTNPQDAFSRLTWSPKFHAWQMNNHDVDYMISEGEKELELFRKSQQKPIGSISTAVVTSASDFAEPIPAPVDAVISVTTPSTTAPTQPSSSLPSPSLSADADYLLLSLQVVRQKIGIPVLTHVANERVVFDTACAFDQYHQLKKVSVDLVFLRL